MQTRLPEKGHPGTGVTGRKGIGHHGQKVLVRTTSTVRPIKGPLRQGSSSGEKRGPLIGLFCRGIKLKKTLRGFLCDKKNHPEKKEKDQLRAGRPASGQDLGGPFHKKGGQS